MPTLFALRFSIQSILPDLFQPPRSSQALPATDTDGGFARQLMDKTKPGLSDGADAVGVEGQSISNRLAHHLPTEAVATGIDPTVPGTIAGLTEWPGASRKPLEMAGLDAPRRDLSLPDLRVDDGI
jgi:hypothetical protein